MATVKKLVVSLPKELLRRIRKEVPKGGISRFVGEAIRFYLAMHEQKEAIEAGFGA